MIDDFFYEQSAMKTIAFLSPYAYAWSALSLSLPTF